MKINHKKLKDIGLAIGIILGYIVILFGIIITVLLLQTIYSEI